MSTRLTDPEAPRFFVGNNKPGPITRSNQNTADTLDLRPHVRKAVPVSESVISRDETPVGTSPLHLVPEVVPEVVPESVATEPPVSRSVQRRQAVQQGRKLSDWMNPDVPTRKKFDVRSARAQALGADTRQKFYTTREAAAMLRHRPQWIAKQIKKGVIQARKLGGKWMISGFEIHRQLGEVGPHRAWENKRRWKSKREKGTDKRINRAQKTVAES